MPRPPRPPLSPTVASFAPPAREPAAAVLVVDDTDASRYATARWLEQAGYRVTQASTAAEALALLAESPDRADVVVLDVRLPDMHGFEVARRLKSDATTAHLPVLHISAVDIAPADRVAGLERGADAYLAQPFEPEELVACVRVLLRHAEAERGARARAAALETAATAAVTAYHEAAAANRAKSDFLARMSHELRTPLNAIAGYAELIELGVHGPVTDEQREDLRRLRTAQRHLLALVAEVLDYVRAESGHLRYELADVAVGEALDALEVLVAPQFRVKGVTFATRPCDDAVRVRADRDRLQQILVNLATNALKFTDAGGRVEVECVARAHDVAIHVRDTGVGIAAEQLTVVFEPFVQGTPSRASDGIGLGLAICRDLARGMGGDVSARSAPGLGSTFTLVLPRALPQTRAEP